MMRQEARRSEQALNADTISSLAEETHQPESLVREIYEEQYARLKARARIQDYVVLFAARRTKDLLARRPAH
jgi:hypothetical protein